MTWPSTNVPATAPTTHGPVRTQAYQAGGGDYFRSGYYTYGQFTSAAVQTLATVAGRLHVTPFAVPVRRGFDRIGIYVTTAATAASGGLVRLGIYSTTNGLPSAVVVDGGTVSSESVGAKEVTVSVSLDPGLYWLGVAVQVSGCTIQSGPTNQMSPYISRDTAPTAAPLAASAPYMTGVSGALPTFAWSGFFAASFPLAGLRAA